jgi:hypothetical protein
MYIGIGTVVFILIIVGIVYLGDAPNRQCSITMGSHPEDNAHES